MVLVKSLSRPWNEIWNHGAHVCRFYVCFMHVFITVAFFFFAEFGLNQKDALNKIRMKFFCLSPDKTRLVAVRVGVCFDAFHLGSPIFIMKVLTSPYDCIFSVSEIASKKKKSSDQCGEWETCPKGERQIWVEPDSSPRLPRGWRVQIQN